MNDHSSASVRRVVMLMLTIILTACMPGDESAGEPIADQHQGDGHAEHDERSEHRKTQIEPAMAVKFGLETEPAGSADIVETVQLFGQVLADPTRSVDVRARFPGLIRSVLVEIGDRIEAGAALATVESDESLKSYTLSAPAGGVVVVRQANPGEQTGDRTLFRIVDPSEVWVELQLFPGQRKQVAAGQKVYLSDTGGEPVAVGEIDWIGIEARADQSVAVRVTLRNPDGRLLPGMHLSADVAVDVHTVPVAVHRTGLQSLDGNPVVFVQSGDTYEPRVVALGRQDSVRVEVRSGLNPGERYVTENSYLIKADLEKDSASHDH